MGIHVDQSGPLRISKNTPIAANFILAATLILSVTACEDSGDAEAAAGWLEAFYRQAPIAAGWSVERVDAQGGMAIIFLTAPASAIPAPLTHKKADELGLVASEVACPGSEEEIWAILGGKRLFAQVERSPGSGDVIASARCAPPDDD